MKDFMKGNSHLAVVYNQTKFVGIVTLEDIIEEILNQEIYDE